MKHVVLAGISGGIGNALAWRLLAADPGITITGLCRRPGGLEIGAEDRVRLLSWDALTATPENLRRQLSSVLPDGVPVDTVIYAAGLLHGEDLFPEKRLEDVRAGAMDQAFRVNATGFLTLVQALLPWLRHRDFKRVLAVSAKVGSLTDNGMGGWYAYRSSKAALNMMVRNLAVELPRRCRPVACVAVHPGTTRTALSEPFSQSLAQLRVHDPADTAANLWRIANDLSAADNGRFVNWDGGDLPW